MDYTHVALLASVRRLAALPTATAAGSASSDLLAHANEVLQSEVVPFVLDLREDYFLQVKDRSVTSGTASYRLPSRAVGAKLREVVMVSSGGDVRNLYRLQPDELEDYGATSGTPEGFYLRGNQVVLVPAPSGTSEALRLTYYIRPNELVSTAYGTISAINTTSGLVSFTATGTFQPTTSSVLDLVSASSGFESLSIDQTPTAAVAGVSVTIAAADLPSDLLVGDYVCTQQQAPVPQVAAEFHPLLYALTSLRMAETLGNTARVGYLAQKCGAIKDQLRSTFAPRVDGEPKIVSPDGNGLMGGYDWAGWW